MVLPPSELYPYDKPQIVRLLTMDKMTGSVKQTQRPVANTLTHFQHVLCLVICSTRLIH
jgi:hypothetical protein